MRTMTGVARRLLFILLALPGVGCGSSELRLAKAPEEPLGNFFQVEVSPVAVDLAGPADPELLEDAGGVAEVILARLRLRLSKSKMFDHPGRKLIVKGRIVEFDPGSRTLRYFVGFGAGTATVSVALSLVDEEGIEVASGAVSADLWGGFFGGGLDSLGRKVADAIFRFIKENYGGREMPKEPPAS